MKAPALFKSGLVTAAALTVSVASAQVILEGDVLRVGVNTRGGLIDNNFAVGIGWAGEKDPNAFDFLKPNSGLEFFALGYNQAAAVSRYSAFTDDIFAETVQPNAGELLAHTVGDFQDLKFSQIISFDPSSNVIDFSITLVNEGQTALANVLYARGFDANPDSFLALAPTDQTPNTLNRIHGEGDIVTSAGPESGWMISIIAGQSEASHVASIGGQWTDPYSLLSGSSSLLNGNHVIAMAWDAGTLAPGASKTINFQYKVEPVPPVNVPDRVSTLALLALPMIGLAAIRLSRRRRRA
jgi:hypothetical protein